jgi:hypothetical protein
MWAWVQKSKHHAGRRTEIGARPLPTSAVFAVGTPCMAYAPGVEMPRHIEARVRREGDWDDVADAAVEDSENRETSGTVCGTGVRSPRRSRGNPRVCWRCWVPLPALWQSFRSTGREKTGRPWAARARSRCPDCEECAASTWPRPQDSAPTGTAPETEDACTHPGRTDRA